MKEIPDFFGSNLPIQVVADDDGNISVLNYMPRRESLCWVDLDEDELGDMTQEEYFCHVAAHFENLARLMREAGKSKEPFVYYPDKGIQPYTINGTTYGNKPTE